jgi:hypothetical protein
LVLDSKIPPPSLDLIWQNRPLFCGLVAGEK